MKTPAGPALFSRRQFPANKNFLTMTLGVIEVMIQYIVYTEINYGVV
jgi:hypothetical protein